MKKIQLLLLFLFSLIVTFSNCQQLEFEHLSDKDGLVNTNVTCVFKDSYGYIWTGTFNGLSKYDGYNFTNYLNDPLNPSSITDNSIRFISESSDHSLIIGHTFAGICVYNRETETFTRYRHNAKDPNSLRNDYVKCIYQDKQGNTWIGTMEGLDRFELKTGKFIHYNAPQQEKRFVSGITEDREGNLWLYGRGNEVCKFNPLKNTYDFIAFTDNPNQAFIRGGTILCDRKGNLWIGNEKTGLYRFDPKTGKSALFCVENNSLSSNMIFSMIEDSEGQIWIGTDGGGIYIYNYSTNKFKNLQNNPEDLYSLSGNGVYCVYESEPGVFWVGAFAGGLNVYKKYKKKFFKYTTTGLPGHRLSHRTILSMAEAPDGKIWLGTDGGGLNLFDPENGTFKYYNTKNSIIHSDIIKSICVDSENNLWLGSYGKGLCKVNFDKGEVHTWRGNLEAKGETILGDNVFAIAESYDKKIWVGLLNYGIQVYDPATNKFTYYPFDSTAFRHEVSSVHILFQDSKKRMWIGVENYGVGYYDPAKKTFVHLQCQHNKPGTLGNNTIRDIFEDSQGNIWIAGFMGGLKKLIDPEKGQFVHYSTKDGLATDNIFNILEDDHHNLWLSTDKGISLFKVAEKKFINFTQEDGLQSAEFNSRSALKTRTGYMCFGGIKGFNIFHPDSIHYNNTPPRIVLTDFKIFDHSIKPNKDYNGNIYLAKTVSLASEILLEYRDNIFSIEFAALDFTSSNKNKYAYRLKGFNDEWTYVNADKRYVTYTNLDPGEYIFQVKGSNNDGVWNTEGATLKIIILPPWWMTWWFRAGALLFAVLLVVGFYYVRLQSIRERNKFLEEEVKKHTAVLKETNNHLEHLNQTKDKFFSIIAHDLKGPVKALTSLTTQLSEGSETMSKEMQQMLIKHVNSSSHKIHDLVLGLLEWARTQSRQVKVDFMPIPVPKLFRENMELLSIQAAQKHIELKIESDDTHVAVGDYNMITTIVRNILSNSIKYTSQGGLITLASSIDKKELKISIADNGIGMSEEVLNKLFSLEKGHSVKGTNNETGTGLGLIIAKEFTELNKGKIYAESTLGKGSTFYLILPLSNNSG